MRSGEQVLHSTSFKGLRCLCPSTSRIHCLGPSKQSTNICRQLIIRCARQRPQRPSRVQQQPVDIPSRPSEDQQAHWSEFEDTNPYHRAGYVAIIGKPNAGKSTLLNAILQQKLSIVTSKAQTTRHRIIAAHSEDNFQCIFLDTPGVLRPVLRPEDRSKLDERMMRSVGQASRDADAMLIVVDASDPPEKTLSFLEPTFKSLTVPTAVVLNKIDLLFDYEVEKAAQAFQEVPSVETVIPVAAARERNVKAVEEWAVSHLPLGPALYPKDTVSEHPERFFVGEIIREKIFQQYREEVPYCSSVQITDFKERSQGKDMISACIFVEQESQKGIVVGRKGSALKALGTAARADIETFLGRPVFLELTVKVKEKWRKSEAILSELGY